RRRQLAQTDQRRVGRAAPRTGRGHTPRLHATVDDLGHGRAAVAVPPGERGNLPVVYRFLWSPRWIGLGLLMTLAAATMVGLGLWQLARYHYRSDINTRIDAASANPPQPLASVLAPPAG